MAKSTIDSSFAVVGSTVVWCGAHYRLVAGPVSTKDANGSTLRCWLGVAVGRSGHELSERKGGGKLVAIPCAELADVGTIESKKCIERMNSGEGVNEAYNEGRQEAFHVASSISTGSAACSGGMPGGSADRGATGERGVRSQAAAAGRGAPQQGGSGGSGRAQGATCATVAYRLRRSLGCSPAFALTLIALLALLSAMFD